MFIEYDYYYHFTSGITCYGRQEYPLIEEPRYISNEYDNNKHVLFLDNGINFKPAWVDCEEFADLDYLDINHQLQNLFKLFKKIFFLEKYFFTNILEGSGRCKKRVQCARAPGNCRSMVGGVCECLCILYM